MLNSRVSSLFPLARGFLRYQNLPPHLILPGAVNLKILNTEQKRGYKNFGHKPEREPLITKIFILFLLSGVLATMVDWRWCRMLFLQFTGQVENTKNKGEQNEAK